MEETVIIAMTGEFAARIPYILLKTIDVKFIRRDLARDIHYYEIPESFARLYSLDIVESELERKDK